MASKIRQIKKQTWFRLLVIFVSWWLLLFVVGNFAIHLINPAMVDRALPGPDLLNYSFGWDSGWYSAIANMGYGFSPSAPAFYPLYPLLLHLVTSFTHLNMLTASMLVNTVASFVAIYFLYLLALDFSKNKNTAYLAVLLFLFFPMGYFLHVGYSEAVFCALSFGAVYFARQRNWLGANILAGLASASRLAGVLVIGVVALEYLASKQFQLKRIGWEALSFLLAPLGIVGYSLYLWRTVHDPLAMVHAYNYGDWAYLKFDLNMALSAKATAGRIAKLLWHRASGWQQAFFNEFAPFMAWLSLFGFAALGVVKKLPLSYTLYIVGTIVLLGTHTSFVSSNRYILVVFPIYLLLADWLSRRAEHWRTLAVALSAGVMILYFVLFVNGIWTA